MSAARQPSSEPLEVLLAHLKATRGFDFTGYKRTSLERRIQKRMEAVGVSDYGDYLDYLELHQDEFPALFDTILINVTGFFRDPPAWEYYSTDIVPRLLETVGPHEQIRAWSAGCASGEEPYTLAMVLAEALGTEAYLERVKIYATEVDEDALNQARQASYTAGNVEAIPAPLLERYFDQGDQRYSFRKDLRRTVIFGRNDLTQDAPISRIDLLTCRNTLMYFNAETQARILNRFHFALNPWGYLFLGKSEMLITHSDLFRPVDLKRRVFAKVQKETLRERLFAGAHGSHDLASAPIAEIRDGAFEVSPGAYLVVDVEGTLVMANAHARTMFGLSQADVGRPIKDLELSFRPVDLRSNLEVAFKEFRSVSLTHVASPTPSGEVRALDVQITPVGAPEHVLGAAILYQDTSHVRRLEDDLETTRRDLGTAYEELQSTVEELETTNEELHSTNEELETMNEELQSTNEELETMNDELRERSLELNEVNAFLEAILSTMGVAVIVVDHEHRVQVWNAESTELWGVRPDEAQGQHLFGLDIGLPLDGVRGALRRVLAGADDRVDVELSALNRRGRTVDVKVTLMPLGAAPDVVSGAILLTAPVDGHHDGADGADGSDGATPSGGSDGAGRSDGRDGADRAW
jgi:two-component system CheB/CheR fusion protein